MLCMCRRNLPEFLEFAFNRGKFIVIGAGLFCQFQLFNRAVQVAVQGIGISECVVLFLTFVESCVTARFKFIQARIAGVADDLFVEQFERIIKTFGLQQQLREIMEDDELLKCAR